MARARVGDCAVATLVQSGGVATCAATRKRCPSSASSFYEASSVREEIYDGRYNKKLATVKFSDFVDEQFLPWAKGNKLSYADDERRCKLLKDVFGNQPMRDITPLQIERFKLSLVGKKTRAP